ncbi:hypothetical protein FRC03_010906 [Tulasnella sp. 419]|nr:hypothetical protein FRC03_010906 [Tulasnella sp. 419]
MHKALSIDEIIRKICTQVLLDSIGKPRNQSARPSLLSLAVPCKAFKEAALDALWEVNTNPKSIFYPFVAWGNFLEESRELRLVRHVTHTDWIRYAPYAARVVDVLWFPNSKISVEACLSLLSSYPKTSLFKRIRRLSLSGSTLTEYPAASLFSSPSLLALELHPKYTSAYTAMPSLLINMGSGSTNMKQLKVVLREPTALNQDIAHGLASSLESLPNLQDFNLEASSSSLSHLVAALPHLSCLRKLHLASNSSEAMGLDPFNWAASINDSVCLFPMLTDLSMISRNTEVDLHTFDRLAQLCPLNSVSLKFAGQCGPGELVSIFQSIHDNVWGDVRSLTIELQTGDTPGSVAPDQLQALFHQAFASLKLLHLDGYLLFDVNDSSLELLGESCPLLESLHFRTYSSRASRASPKATLAGLIHLARKLLNLMELTLPVNVTDLDAVRDAPTHDSKLIWWDPSYSTVSDPFEATAILLYHFPKLQSVEMRRELWGGPSDERELERARSAGHFKEIHKFISRMAYKRKPGQSTRDAAKDLFG